MIRLQIDGIVATSQLSGGTTENEVHQIQDGTGVAHHLPIDKTNAFQLFLCLIVFEERIVTPHIT